MDDAQFEELLSGARGAMLRLANLRISPRPDAEDVVQEACLKAFRSMESLEDPGRFRAWVLEITRNAIRDYYRARFRSREEPMTAARGGNRAHAPARTDVECTLERLPGADRDVLTRYYLLDQGVADIAQRLGLPPGTVKSRLYAARGRFREAYPLRVRGEGFMRKLPEFMPEYAIRESGLAPFPVRFEESVGWFVVPRVGEVLNWAMYDFPGRKRTEFVETAVVGKASVHGIEGVEVTVKEHIGGEIVERTLIMQLTDTHSRILSETHRDGDVKRTFTFLDGDDFLKNWGFGEDNCGNEIFLAPKGEITREGDRVTSARDRGIMDVVGRYEVTLDGKAHDTVCLMDIECYEGGVATEQYIDLSGRTVLWRRFNSDAWKQEKYGGPWSVRMPENERILINGRVYVHWYDCLTDRGL